MTSDDVTDGCAFSYSPCPSPREFCAASFRLKKIEGQVLESDITRRRNALASRFAARGIPFFPLNPLRLTFHVS